MKNAVITGPTGAIGIALINELISSGIMVTAVCRRNSARIDRLPKSDLVRVVECNLDEYEKLPELITDSQDVFYHFAWGSTTGLGRNDIPAQEQNLKSALVACESAAKLGCKVFIGSGSQAEYGRVEGVLKSETPCFPENGYGIAKLSAGMLTRIRAEQLGMKHIWTRILSVYGPYDGEGTLVISMIRKLLNDESPKTTKGEQIWDFIYSKDAARAFKMLAENGIHGKVYPIGSGNGRPLREYIEAISKEANPEVEIGFGEIPYAPKQVMHLCADISELTKDVGFMPEVSFEEGIKNTVEWCRRT